MTILCRT